LRADIRTVAPSLLCIVALVALQAITAFAIERAAIIYAWMIPAQLHLGYFINPSRWGAMNLIVLGSNLLEVLALYGLFRFLPADRTPNLIKAFTAGGVATMLAVSLSVRLTGFDAILYIYFAKVANLATAYHTPPSLAPVPADFAVLHHLIPKTKFASPYGPLWELFDRGLLAGTHSVGQAVFMLKAANSAALLATFATLLALRLPFRQAALFYLNPALYDNYVVQAHNDLFAVLPILVALLFARRGNFLAAALLASVAGLVKFSLVAVALATIASMGKLRTRLRSAGLILAVLVLGSLLIGGSPYLHALVFVGKAQSHSGGNHILEDVRLALEAALVTVSCVALVDAVFWKRLVRSATWTFPGLSGLLHMWYFPWTIPFAIRFRATAAALAISLPLFEVVTTQRAANLIKVGPATLTLLVLAALGFWELARTKGRGEVSSAELAPAEPGW